MEWMPVYNCVPAEGSFVLVSVNNTYIDIAFYRLGRFVIDTKQVHPEVWMPLPRPYHLSRHERGYHEFMKRATLGESKC